MIHFKFDFENSAFGAVKPEVKPLLWPSAASPRIAKKKHTMNWKLNPSDVLTLMFTTSL